MPTPVKMPQLGETVVEGTVARWLKQPGDVVERQEPLLDITTDKIDTEVPAPAAGILLKIVAAEGTTVRVGSVIAYIGDAGEEAAETEAEGTAALAMAQSSEIVAPYSGAQYNRAAVSSPTSEMSAEMPAPTPAASVEKPTGRAFISPVVARISAEYNIDLAEVEGSGRHGRITKKDVLAFIAGQSSQQRTSVAPYSGAPYNIVSARPAAQRDEAQDSMGADEILQPLSAMRQAIAEHMSRSVRISPHVVTIFEADMTAVVRHRAAHKQAFAQKGIGLTFTPYFVAAVTGALRDNLTVNSRLTDEGLLISRRIHVGMAVAVADGLVAPVIRDADERNLQGLARAVNDLAARARCGRLAPDELRGGTFTVTNHGVSGSLLGTPIINQPQAAILGIGKISKRPVVRSGPLSGASSDPLLPSADDAICIRPMCYLSFAFDHRILDGASADRFVADVVKRLETWRT